MKTLLTCAFLIVLASGCLSRRVRDEAAATLDCPSLTDVRHDTENDAWMAEGCGRVAICSNPRDARAEVQCAGGGPAQASR